MLFGWMIYEHCVAAFVQASSKLELDLNSQHKSSEAESSEAELPRHFEEISVRPSVRPSVMHKNQT
eukprot:scaffold3866_cov70-Skeletonema_menzelii.AAC.1